MIKIINVEAKSEHIDILFSLLRSRNHEFSISHTELPSHEAHSNFVKQKPYRYWYLVYENGKAFGSAYISYDNTIGINLVNNDLESFKTVLLVLIKKHTPLPSIKSIRGDSFYINVNPRNLNLISMLENIGAIHLQNSYSFSNLTRKRDVPPSS
jgi:hypothetical protein